MNRVDMISQQDQSAWSNHFGRQGMRLYNTNAIQGKGVNQVMLLSTFSRRLFESCPGKPGCQGAASLPLKQRHSIYIYCSLHHVLLNAEGCNDPY